MHAKETKKTREESLSDEENQQEFSDTLKGRKALERWAKLQDENQGC